MTNKEQFIAFIEARIDINEMPKEAKAYWNDLKVKKAAVKAPFTVNGATILNFLQTKEVGQGFTSAEIGENVFMSGRTVSGSIRKLVTDGYVEKVGEGPVMYAITETGKTVEVIAPETK